MEISDVIHRSWKDRGRSTVDYRVLGPDLRVICTTPKLDKAERIAEQCNGTVHCSRELSDAIDPQGS